jgi:hypothetical protein
MAKRRRHRRIVKSRCICLSKSEWANLTSARSAAAKARALKAAATRLQKKQEAATKAFEETYSPMDFASSATNPRRRRKTKARRNSPKRRRAHRRRR